MGENESSLPFFYYEKKVRIVVSEIECNVNYHYIKGVVVGSKFYPEEAFKKVVEKINNDLNKDEARLELIKAIKIAQRRIKNGGNDKRKVRGSKGLMLDWDNVERLLFGEPQNVGLLAGYNTASSGGGAMEAETGGIIFESEANLYGNNINQYGNIGIEVRNVIKNIDNEFKSVQINGLFGKHYRNYLQQAESRIANEDIKDVYKWAYKFKLDTKTFYSFKEDKAKTYISAVYGARVGQKSLYGNLYEAYVGHLVNYHKQLVSLNMQGVNVEALNSALPIYRPGGGGELQGVKSFLNLLNFATGSDKWTNGGDILAINKFVDENGAYSIMANFQIKSQIDEWAKVHLKISYKNLYSLYDSLLAQIEKKQIDADYLYSALSIDALQVELGKKVNETANLLAEMQK